jgi:hypothetical protein
LHAIFRYAPRASFNGLFRSAHASLLQAAASPDNGAFIPGGISVLHTWNQKLTFHPHIHCIVPAGGISVDGTIWVHRNGEFLLPTRVLACLFRGNLLAYLETAMLKGELGSIDRYNAKHQLCLAAAKDFVVYCKPPFGGPRQVLKYLGRYTHRVGISEERLVAGGDGSATVSFIYLDRAHGHVKRTLTLSNQDFVDRFRLHILPNGLRKIRYFGYMGNRHRGENLNRVRDLILQAPGKPRQTAPETPALSDSVCSTSETKTTPQTCPICHRKLILDTSNQIGRAWAPPPLAERLRRLRKPAVAQAGPAPT